MLVKRAKEEKSREGGIAASWKWRRGLELQIRRLERSPPPSVMFKQGPEGGEDASSVDPLEVG